MGFGNQIINSKLLHQAECYIYSKNHYVILSDVLWFNPIYFLEAGYEYTVKIPESAFYNQCPKYLCFLIFW